jgi:sulfur relay (sulfurtransferase) complex TusBCD TusD component (DsrE family)
MTTSLTLAADSKNSLFVNLSSDEINRAAMAISFAHKVLKKKQIPVTIWLNVEGVRLVDINIPQNTYVNGKTVREMLQTFMKDGGKVIICPMCMKNVGGLDPDMDLLKGVTTEGTLAALFAENVTVLSY